MLPDDLVMSFCKNSHLDLDMVDIDDYSLEEWTHLCSLLLKNPVLEYFSLKIPAILHTENPLVLDQRSTIILFILSALEQHSHLKKLEFSIGFMRNTILDKVKFVIQHNRDLFYLGLSHNQLKKMHLESLFSSINNGMHLNVIDLSHNLLEFDAINILKSIIFNKKLYSLDLSSNRLANSAIQLLLKPNIAEYDHQSMEFLYLCNNNINRHGLSKLHNKIGRKKFVLSTSRLFLTDNRIGPQGGESLAKIIKNGALFTEIHLKNTHITDKVIMKLCDAIIQKLSSDLRVLNLEKIYIGFNAAVSISELIRKVNGLEVLLMSYDKIDPPNKLLISEGLKDNYSIKKFHFVCDESMINHYKSPHKLGESILNIFRESKTLEQIEFSPNWSGKEAKTYSDIILDNFYDLNKALNILSEISIIFTPIKENQDKYLSLLNLSHVFIARIDQYYASDHKRGPEHANDLSKATLFSFQATFYNKKKIFRNLSKRVAFYEEILINDFGINGEIFDQEINGIINDFMGNNLHNSFLTHFMLGKRKDQPLVEDIKTEEAKDDLIPEKAKVGEPNSRSKFSA